MKIWDNPKNNGKIQRWTEKICTCNRECPIFDKIVMIYIAAVFLFQVFFQISPIVTILAATPLYSIQTYLGLLGGVLIVVDLFTTKKVWQGKYSILLYGILAFAAVASVRMISYGVKENLYKLCWAAIQFVLVYSCSYRLNRESLIKYLRALYLSLLVIWIAACCVSLYQYVNQIGYMYVVNPLAMDPSSNRQGFYDNRLFGIFYTLNHAAYMSLMFLIIGVFFTIKAKRLLVKIVIGSADMILLCHVLLSGSRSAYVALLICTLCIAWMLAYNQFARGWRKVVMPVAVAVLALVLVVVGCNVLKAGLAKIPSWYDQITEFNHTDQTGEMANPTNAVTEPTEGTTESTEGTTESTEGATESTEGATESTEGTTESTEGMTGATQPDEEQYEDILHRDNLEEDPSNGRISIWKDYISLYQEIGIIGLSPGNYMPYILENHPELYIVELIRDYYPDKYESGIIYHVHSGYMMVYVSAGAAGILLLAAFVILCLLRIARKILNCKKIPYLFVCVFALALAGAISAAFDEGLFFQNNPHTSLFWLALGILIKESAVNKTECKD